MVNNKRGAAVYTSPEQPFSFNKHIRFGDRSNQPDLKSDTDSGNVNVPSGPQAPSSHNVPHSSTPYHGMVHPSHPLNHTFDMSGIPLSQTISRMLLQLQLRYQQQHKPQRSSSICENQKLSNLKVDILWMPNWSSGHGG